jgi:hypothetical protein
MGASVGTEALAAGMTDLALAASLRARLLNRAASPT